MPEFSCIAKLLACWQLWLYEVIFVVYSKYMAQKRIHNPATGRYYAIRQRTTANGKKGQISGVYKSVQKNYGNAIKRLGST